jgi:undecaprenyl-diphosphatase
MISSGNLDRLLTLQINNGAGHNAVFDKLIFDVADSTLLKGGVFLAAYTWLWLEGARTSRPGQRHDVVVALAAAVVAVFVSRALQVGLPFHHRPLHTPDLGLHLPLSVRPETLNTFSSFPSDHAVLFFALCVPLWTRSRWLGTAAALWTLLVICLPRVYLGYHWVSDIVAGAVVGIALMLPLRRLLSATALPDQVLRLAGARPVAFYTLSWLIMLELAVMFQDLRHFVRDAVHLAQALAA